MRPLGVLLESTMPSILWITTGCSGRRYSVLLIVFFQCIKIILKDAIFYFLPYSMVMTFLGRVHILETFYVGSLNFGFGAFLMTWFLLLIGLVSIFRGTTNYESKTMKSNDEESLPILAKFENVFGRFGYFHFLVPFLPINNNDAYCEPGYRRLLGPGYA